MSTNEILLGSYTTWTASVWPVMPEQASSISRVGSETSRIPNRSGVNPASGKPPDAFLGAPETAVGEDGDFEVVW
eukprot:CAMPEP_0181181782 /NCGR_PEP_ID=MMETSP1096-20121128/7524_1 /TAXON_ID=156174 ORGANISM="Chrysochromulina ericina, Strain CCMP281" /NCGR_SAMPLE_ID=MMETSP1096 /ASSEMBLY_ACC=CAM_ASM_000453 /LENGTH=74 /DNA_ID=CAMNT_0023270315 /DNA_START=721 /DNA_END=941 /DNA_ORIENTATION=-